MQFYFCFLKFGFSKNLTIKFLFKKGVLKFISSHRYSTGEINLKPKRYMSRDSTSSPQHLPPRQEHHYNLVLISCTHRGKK